MTVIKDQLVKYFNLEQLQVVEKEFVDVMENMKEILNLNIDNSAKWQLLVREVNHNNNYEYANPDQVRELNNTGHTEHLDIMCGDYKATGVEIMVSINENITFDQDNLACNKKVLSFSQFFDINLEGEDYPFEDVSVVDLDNAMAELEVMENNSILIDGSIKSLNITVNNRPYRIEVDEDTGTISTYEVYTDSKDRLLNRTFLNIRSDV